MSELSSCPDEYYDNCLNALKCCKQCCAGGLKQGKLLYSPNDTSLMPHPYSKDVTKQKRLKEAKQVEKEIIKSVNKIDASAKGTVRSGAEHGDGDCHLLNGDLRVEIKDRGNRASWNVTWDEYQKGRKQGIDIFAISAVNPDGVRRTMFMMEEVLYNELISQLRENK